VEPGPSASAKLLAKLRKIGPLVAIFLGASWLFSKGVTTDTTRKRQ